MSNFQFREKLLPPFWAWLFLIGISLMLSVSMSAIFGTNIAIVIFILISSFLCVVTYVFSPELKIDSQYFYAGKAMRMSTRLGPTAITLLILQPSIIVEPTLGSTILIYLCHLLSRPEDLWEIDCRIHIFFRF